MNIISPVFNFPRGTFFWWAVNYKCDKPCLAEILEAVVYRGAHLCSHVPTHGAHVVKEAWLSCSSCRRGLLSICSKLDLLIEVGDLGGLRLAFFQAWTKVLKFLWRVWVAVEVPFTPATLRLEAAFCCDSWVLKHTGMLAGLFINS